jgi:hypothetical protein
MDIDAIIVDYNKDIPNKKNKLSPFNIIRFISIIIIFVIAIHYFVMRDHGLACKHKSVLFIALLVVFDIIIDMVNLSNMNKLLARQH